MFHFRDEKSTRQGKPRERRHIIAVQLESKMFDPDSGDKRGRGHSSDLDNCRFDTFQYSVQQNVKFITILIYRIKLAVKLFFFAYNSELNF
ncbi:hypothetical protein V1478_010443 [Vespula squamosa]|uniref:Uncharacterized protein n=1 Tax=Vespula squamosa TaxID=30214 RepID=A0ABD2AHT0_VESSQ